MMLRWLIGTKRDKRRYLHENEDIVVEHVIAEFQDGTTVFNAYQVLLTRAWQGMVIFVPEGNLNDPTRPPSYYDGTFNFLRDCGIESLD